MFIDSSILQDYGHDIQKRLMYYPWFKSVEDINHIIYIHVDSKFHELHIIEKVMSSYDVAFSICKKN